MNASLKIGLVSALALGVAAPALAQYQPDYQYQRPSQYDPQPAPQYQPTEQYRQDQQRYEQDRSDYQARRDAYDARHSAYETDRYGYEQARSAYERRRAYWERARARYDARYGYGAYIRVYGPAPAWDTTRWGPYYASPTYYSAPAATYYGRDTAYVSGCRNDHSAPGRHTENSVIGGVLGGVIGNAVGSAHDRYKCDTRGPYYSYGDTIVYREDPNWRSGRYDYGYYSRMRCRLAPAAVDPYGNDVRYVRVCPDADGRYRITG